MSEYDDQLTTTRPDKRRRGPALAAAGVLLAGTLGAGAWAATQFLGGGGPQPASALPADTLAVLSLDLDPSVGQKVQARDFVRKFPGLKNKGTSDGDVRKVVWNWLDLDCKQTSFDDAESWLGDRAALAAVPHGKQIETVVVVEVTDQAKARDAVKKLGDCHGHGDADPEHPDETEVAFVGDYLVATDAKGLASAIAKSATESSLADTSGYRDWTERAGGHGLVTGYLAKTAPGRFLDQMESFGAGVEQFKGEVSSSAMPPEMQETGACPNDECIDTMIDTCTDPDCDEGECTSDEECDLLEPFDSGPIFDKLRALYKDFEGAAATVSFDDGDLTGHVATRGLKNIGFPMMIPGLLAAGDPTPVGNLPTGSAIALSTSLADGWATSYLDVMEGMFGVAGTEPEATPSKLTRELEEIFGKSASISVGANVTEQALESPQKHRGAEFGIRIVGDPKTIEPALRGRTAKDPDLKGLVIVPGDGVVAAGFNAEYVGKLAAAGSLGQSDRFNAVVADADRASLVLFADFDADSIAQLVADSFDLGRADADRLDSFGYSQATDDDSYVHGRLRVRTD